MSDLWLTVGIPAAAAIATAVYTTGGRAALARRALREELEIAAMLPAGDGRASIERLANERAILYASRWFGPEPLSVRGHLVLLGAFALFGGAAQAAATGSERVNGGWLSSSFLLLSITCTGIALMSIVTWISTFFLADNARSRAEKVEDRRERVSRRLTSYPPTPPSTVL